MDLYGYNPGTTTSNDARARVAQGNIAVMEFNKGLDSQVDSLKLEQQGVSEQLLSDRNTALGAGSTNAIAKLGLKKIASKAAAEQVAAKIAASPSLDTLAANQAAATAERVGNRVAVRAGQSAVQGSAVGRAELSAGEAAGTRLVPAGEVGVKAGMSAAEVAGGLAKGLGVVGGLATVGIEAYKLESGKTKFKDENHWQQAGQIASIAGGGLQILGAITAWTGFGFGIEAAGTALALAGTAAEEVGDEKAADKANPKAVADITDQKRITSVAQTSGVEVSRSD